MPTIPAVSLLEMPPLRMGCNIPGVASHQCQEKRIMTPSVCWPCSSHHSSVSIFSVAATRTTIQCGSQKNTSSFSTGPQPATSQPVQTHRVIPPPGAEPCTLLTFWEICWVSLHVFQGLSVLKLCYSFCQSVCLIRSIFSTSAGDASHRHSGHRRKY